MLTQRIAGEADLDAMWALRTRAVRASCASHYAPEVIAQWAAAPPPPRHAQLTHAGGAVVAEEDGCMLGFAVLNVAAREIDAVFVDLLASLNAVPFYEMAGFVRIRDEAYPHSSGIRLDSVFMEKRLR